MKKKTTHVGWDDMLSQRDDLLKAYDKARRGGSDDPTNTWHGNVGESQFRHFLGRFLPQKFGVAKGYIITPNVDYTSKLQEWDIIIYNAQESPILFYRETPGSTPMPGIPVNQVRAVIEVKARLTPALTKHAVEKLVKLRAFETSSQHDSLLTTLPQGFFTAAVFFETGTKDEDEFSRTLDKLQPLFMGPTFACFTRALIIRAHKKQDKSAQVLWRLFEHGDQCEEFRRDLSEPAITSTPFTTTLPSKVCRTGLIYTPGFGQNDFWEFAHALTRLLARGGPGPMPEGFGIDPTKDQHTKWLPLPQKKKQRK